MTNISSCWLFKALKGTPFWVILLSLLFSGIVHSDQTNSSESGTSYKVLVLGDSLSAAYGLSTEQGWVSLLAQKWQQDNTPISVVNAAISGDTTDGGLARLPRLLALHEPSHVYIELGGNNGLQGHNPKKIEQNLRALIELCQKNEAKVILQEMQIPSNYGARYTRSFNAIYHDLAKQYELPLVPFFLQEIGLNKELMQRDGIHPTANAQPIIAEALSKALKDAILAE